MVVQLIAALRELCPEVTEIILTENIPEEPSFSCLDGVTVVRNRTPQGFGRNHNEAFRISHEDYFCVLNPDIELTGNPFPELVTNLRSGDAGIAVPVVRAGNGAVEDSVRHFPTVRRLFRKLLLQDRGRMPIDNSVSCQYIDWGAGMCMLFARTAFEQLCGFDERYFMYYEDADICLRAWKNAIPVILASQTSVIHHARRDSHRRLRYLLMHLRSMERYFRTHGLVPHRFPAPPSVKLPEKQGPSDCGDAQSGK